MTIGYARVSTSGQNLDGQCAVSGKILSGCERVHDAGASMKSLRETWLGTSTPQGNLLFTIFAGLLQFERDPIRQRTKSGPYIAIIGPSRNPSACNFS